MAADTALKKKVISFNIKDRLQHAHLQKITSPHEECSKQYLMAKIDVKKGKEQFWVQDMEELKAFYAQKLFIV